MSRTAIRAPWRLVVPATFLLAWGGNHFTPLLHVYESVGHYAAWQANLLLGTYVAGLAPGLLVAAALSDRHGRRPVMLVGMAATVLGSALLAASPHVFALLCLGRVLAGLGVGAAMSVGTAWMKELSAPPYEIGAPAVAGARRPSLTLTLGFALGAGASGLLAQFAPLPEVLPYLVHGGLSLLATPLLLLAPETRHVEQPAAGHWWQDLRVPAAGHRRFTRAVVPAAPWIFGAAGVAYAVIPASVQRHLGESATLYATALTVLTLGTGAVVQSFVPRLDRLTGGRSLPVGQAAMCVGLVLAVIATAIGSPVLGILVAMVLGAAYGTLVVAGLLQVQGIATAEDLAGLTGVYYALAYLGFLLPTILAALLPLLAYPASLSMLVVLCALCLLLVRRGLRTA